MPHLAHVHLKDTTGGKGNWNFPAIGDGVVDFARVLEILREAGYAGPYSVEIEFQGEPWPPLAEVNDAMRRSYEHLSSLGLLGCEAGSIFMPEMTNLQVREYLEGGGRTVIVPVGSTEDHGDHGPLWTDVYIPLEVAKRAAPELEALVGPPIPFGIAHDHRGAHGLVHLRMDTFMDLVRDVCLSLSDVGFTRIVLLNGHYCNSHALEFAVARFHDELPGGHPRLPVPVLGGAGAGGGGAVPLRDAPASTRTSARRRSCSPSTRSCATWSACATSRRTLPELRTNALALLDPLFLATPGSFWALLEDGGGVWGEPSESTAEKGEEFLEWATTAVVNLVRDMDDVHDRLEPRYLRTRRPRGAAR